MGLIEAIGLGPVALDSCTFIYVIEQHPTFGPLLGPVFGAIDRGCLPTVAFRAGVARDIGCVPYLQGRLCLARGYEEILTNSNGLELVPVERALLRGAARLRALAAVKTADAVHMATAPAVGCRTFVTNDRQLPELGGMRVLQLHDFV